VIVFPRLTPDHFGIIQVDRIPKCGPGPLNPKVSGPDFFECPVPRGFHPPVLFALNHIFPELEFASRDGSGAVLGFNSLWVNSLVKFADLGFRNPLQFSNFESKPFGHWDLSQSGWTQSFPVVPPCGVVRPGQIRDRSASRGGLLGGWLGALLGVPLVAAVVPSMADGRPRNRSEINAERRARYEKTSREIDRLVAEAHARLPRQLAQVVGAIYVRFSTWMQDSAEDQVRAMLEFAVANGIFVPREHVYFDLGVRGDKSKRNGLDQLREVLRATRVKVLLLFATNRLFRKVYRTLEFVEAVVSERGIRCVFVKSGVDASHAPSFVGRTHPDTRDWRTSRVTETAGASFNSPRPALDLCKLDRLRLFCETERFDHRKGFAILFCLWDK
jgi:hypothetical protein